MVGQSVSRQMVLCWSLGTLSRQACWHQRRAGIDDLLDFVLLDRNRFGLGQVAQNDVAFVFGNANARVDLAIDCDHVNCRKRFVDES